VSKLKIGDKLPEIILKNQDEEDVNLSDFIGKPMVIYFYPKDHTTGCTIQACAFRDDYHTLSELGAVVFGISGDSPATHKSFRRKNNLPFDLLSDSNDQVRKALGVASSMFGLIPGRVTYTIDSQGTIKHIFNSQLEFKKHAENAIEVVAELLQTTT